MRIFSLMICLFLFGATSYAQKNKILGEWYTSDGEAIIQMYYGKAKGENPRKIYGKLSWMKEPNEPDGTPIRDTENPDESLRNQTLLGLTIIKELEWEEDDDEWLWEDGSAYDPESGNTYSFKAFIDPEKPNVLNCRGYLGFSLIGRTEVWTRKN